MGFNSLQSHIYFCPQSVSGVCLCILARALLLWSGKQAWYNFHIGEGFGVMTLMCSSGRISEEKHLCSGLWKYQLSNLPVAEKKYDIQPRSRLHLCLSLRWYFAFNWLQLELGETWTGDTQSALCSDSVSPQPPIILYYKLDLQANDENAKAYDKLTAPKGQARLHLLLHALLC